jgi:hypothetical protein
LFNTISRYADEPLTRQLGGQIAEHEHIRAGEAANLAGTILLPLLSRADMKLPEDKDENDF